MPARLASAAVLAFALLAAPARAHEIAWGEGVEVMAADELDAHRGGFVAGGMEFNFGAVVTTYIDNEPALTTHLTWTDAGAVIEEAIGQVGRPLADLSPDEIAGLGLEGLADPRGLVLDDENGFTALVHNLSDGALQNILINNADNRDLRQTIDVTLELPGFELTQAALTLERLGIRLSEDMRGLAF